MKPHSFDPLLAKEVGIECAILLFNIEFWIEKNKANNKHFYEGRYWTYNSTKAFAELFPYMSEKVIYNSLQKLIEKGYLIKGNFNQNSFDRTSWYALADRKKDIPKMETPLSQNGNSILPNGKMEVTKRENDINVTDINTDINSNINTDRESRVRDNLTPSKEENNLSLSERTRSAFKEFKAIYNKIRHLDDLLYCRAELAFNRFANSNITTPEAIIKALKAQVEVWELEISKDPEKIKFVPRPENWIERMGFLEDHTQTLKLLKGNTTQKSERGAKDYGVSSAGGITLAEYAKKLQKK